MKISLSMWSLHKYWYEGQWDVLDFMDFAASTKAEGVELLSIFWRDRDKELPLVLEAAKRHNLEIACFCACNNFVVADLAERVNQLKEITDSVDTAIQLGTRIIRVFSGDLPYDGSIDYETGMQYVLDGLSEAAAYAEERGAVLCLENHGLFAGRSDQVTSVIQRVNSSALRSTFDTGNFLLVGQSSSDAVMDMHDVIGHVHVKDFLRVESAGPGIYQALNGDYYLGKIAGEGEVDLPFIFNQLRENGYTGWLSIEFEGNEEQKEGSVKAIDNTYTMVSNLK